MTRMFFPLIGIIKNKSRQTNMTGKDRTEQRDEKINGTKGEVHKKKRKLTGQTGEKEEGEKGRIYARGTEKSVTRGRLFWESDKLRVPLTEQKKRNDRVLKSKVDLVRGKVKSQYYQSRNRYGGEKREEVREKKEEKKWLTQSKIWSS